MKTNSYKHFFSFLATFFVTVTNTNVASESGLFSIIIKGNASNSWLLFVSMLKGGMRKLIPLATVVFCVCLPMITEAQVKADFSANTASGCSPVVVSLTDQSTGNATWWKWDLGNGSTSTERNPGAIYILPGVYNITLIAGNDAGADTLVKKSFVKVYSLPDIDFVATPTTGCLPLAVSFTNKSVANSGTISESIWDLGDGTISKQANPKHVYTSQGSFNVTLSVYNSFGCKQSLTVANFINTPVAVNSDFDYTYSNICLPPATVNFENKSVSNEALVYLWSFGDGTTSADVSPAHIFSKNGSYKITLISKTLNGCADTVVKSITIGTVSSKLISDSSACTNQPVVFKGVNSTVPQMVSWDFGDGTIKDATGEVTHIFTKPGNYKVEMAADFGSCVSKSSKVVVVADKIKPSFTVNPKGSACKLPLAVSFTNTTSGTKSFKWLFGDGTTSTEINPVHNYTKRGSFGVTLVSYNLNGCSDSLFIPDAVNAGAPQITGLGNFPVLGCAPKQVDFVPVVNGKEPVNSYLWSFGDSTTSSAITPSHVYNTTGIFNVSLTINKGTDCAATFKVDSAVRIGAKPVAGFNASPRAGCAAKAVAFTDNSSKDVVSWSWFFGDGGVSTEQNPNYLFIDTGYFSVTLIANNRNCADTLKIDNYIRISPPIAKFETKVVCSLPFQREFNDNSIGAKSWSWDFGDGTNSDLPITGHVYKTKGTYVVALKVTNGDCESITKQTIRVVSDAPDFTYAPEEQVCKNDAVTFMASGYNAADYSKVIWRYGDDSIDIALPTTLVVKHRYKAIGKYKPSLLFTDVNNCPLIVNGKKELKVYGPVAAFTNVAGTCANSVVKLLDSSKTDGIHAIVKWAWNYGDGISESKNAGPFSHKYTETNTYHISLKVTDNFGCTDSVVTYNAVRITKPVANFVTSDTIICANNNIVFTNKSSVFFISSLQWSFGDGTNSNAAGVSKKYTNQGLYDIKLKVEDKFGCRDSIVKAKYIRVVNPVASFSLLDSIGQCPPLLSEPKNLSTGFKSLTWRFGDGSSSPLVDPQHYYSIPGTYELKLVVKGFGNCSDSVSKKILLKGPWGTLNYAPVAGCAPLKVAFSSKAVNVAEFVWDFNNGILQHTKKPATDYTYNTPGSFIPKMVLVDSAGCKVSIEKNDKIVVSDIDAHIKDPFGLLSGCDSAVRAFTDSSLAYNDTITAYRWDFGDNKSFTGRNASHAYTTSGNYIVSLSITSKAGCKEKVNMPLKVTVNKSPSFTITAKDSVCEKTPVSFFTVAAPADTTLTWSWAFGDAGSAVVQNPTHIYNAGGNYSASLKAMSNAGCYASKSVPVYIHRSPIVDAGADTIICYGSSIALRPSGALSYNWNASQALSCLNCATPVAKPAVSSWFVATGTNAQGCKASDSVFVKVNSPINLTATGGGILCLGQTTKLTVAGAELVDWSPANYLDNAKSSSPVFNAGAAGNYTITVTGRDRQNCFSDTASVSIKVYPIPVIKITTKQLVANVGIPVQILTTSSADVTKWKWSPAIGLDNPNKAQPVLKATANRTYTVTATNDGNCSATDEFSVSVLCDGKNLFIPNTFSPNNDGMNDRFFPRGRGVKNIRSIRIFNRWGEVVFEKVNFSPDNPNDGWDGTFRGKDQNVDVYIYMLEVMCDDGSVNKINGNITLIR